MAGIPSEYYPGRTDMYICTNILSGKISTTYIHIRICIHCCQYRGATWMEGEKKGVCVYAPCTQNSSLINSFDDS